MKLTENKPGETLHPVSSLQQQGTSYESDAKKQGPHHHLVPEWLYEVEVTASANEPISSSYLPVVHLFNLERGRRLCAQPLGRPLLLKLQLTLRQSSRVYVRLLLGQSALPKIEWLYIVNIPVEWRRKVLVTVAHVAHFGTVIQHLKIMCVSR